MIRTYRLLAVPALLCLAPLACSDDPVTTASVMAELDESDWRQPGPEDLLYLRLPHGDVIFELAPEFAPRTIENIRKLVSDKYFDGLAVIRSHDNYVAQWGDPAEEENQARSLGSAEETIAPEFDRASDELKIIAVDSRDAYAETVGFADGFHAASDGDRSWLTHCYGTLAVARGMDANSGNGSSLYVVTGHAPRHLDRNLTVVGQVLSGIEKLSALPRGTGPLGFYESPDETVEIHSIRMGNDVPEDERVHFEVLRTDTPAFQKYVQSRTHRPEEFWVHPTGHIEICNINPPVRPLDL